MFVREEIAGRVYAFLSLIRSVQVNPALGLRSDNNPLTSSDTPSFRLKGRELSKQAARKHREDGYCLTSRVLSCLANLEHNRNGKENSTSVCVRPCLCASVCVCVCLTLRRQRPVAEFAVRTPPPGQTDGLFGRFLRERRSALRQTHPQHCGPGVTINVDGNLRLFGEEIFGFGKQSFVMSQNALLFH